MFPHGVDAIIDSAGSWPMVKSLFKFLRKGGRYLQYGSFHSADKLDITTAMLNQLHYREQQYISCSAQTYCFPEALEYMDSGKVRLDHLVSGIVDIVNVVVGPAGHRVGAHERLVSLDVHDDVVIGHLGSRRDLGDAIGAGRVRFGGQDRLAADRSHGVDDFGRLRRHHQ